MGFTPLTFTGLSKFSTDFGTILDRQTKIAQLPITALQNQDSDAITKKTLLGGLSTAADSLVSSLTALGTISTSKSLVASSSDTSVITATNAGATAEGTYTIDSVTSIASAASERTNTGYLDSAATPVGTTGDFRLVIGANTYDFTPTNNTLVGVRDKINSLGAGVTASILTTQDGNYLSLSSTSSGATTLELHDDPAGANTNLLTSTNQGSDLVLHLNGIKVQQSTNFVNSVIPGLNFRVTKQSATPVTISLASDPSSISANLQNFVDSFNTVRGQLSAQVGPSAGLLTGNVAVQQLQAQLRSIASFRLPGGSVRSLADLGITFDTSGKASFDADTLKALTPTQLQDSFSFLGSATTGLGGFASSIQQFTDPINGVIKLEQDGLDRTDKSIQAHIADLNLRLTVMQKGLNAKLQQADALLAGLESQQNTITASLQGLNVVLYGKQSN